MLPGTGRELIGPYRGERTPTRDPHFAGQLGGEPPRLQWGYARQGLDVGGQGLRPETDKRNVYPTDLQPAAYEQIWERFLSALAPLVEAKKLGALLFQFPPWFTIRKSNKQYVLEVAKRCSPLRVAIEFRHASWFDGDNQTETLEFLRRHHLPFVCVDMPQGYPSSIPPVVAATSDLAMMRFHGHSDKWTSKDIHEKFGYEYSTKELKDWAPKVRRLADDAGEAHVLMNNCYSDYAQRNASQLMGLLGLEPPGD